MPTASTAVLCRSCELQSTSQQTSNTSRKKRLVQLLSGGGNNNNTSDNFENEPLLGGNNKNEQRGRSRARGRQGTANAVAAAVRKRAKSLARPTASTTTTTTILASSATSSCQNCSQKLAVQNQPRYSESPEKLNLRPTLSLIVGGGEVVDSNQPKKKNSSNRRRRARSEIRLNNNRNVQQLISPPPPPPMNHDYWKFYSQCHPLGDFNGNNNKEILTRISSGPYAEPRNSRALSRQRKPSRAKSKPRSYQIAANNGLLTIWPGKAGIWLPQYGLFLAFL